MKYSLNNKPLVCMQTTSTCYKNTRRMTVKGILWHSTGANNPWLKRYVQPSNNASDRAEWLKLLGKNPYNNDWNHMYVAAGLNAWIGKLADGTVTSVQSMPWDFAPWGCGGLLNNSHIQFEICEDSLMDKSYFEKAYKEACELTAYLCVLFNLDPHGTHRINGVNVPNILCHKDSYNLGMGTNHGDIYHWFKRYGKDMNDVRNDVAALIKNAGSTIVTPPTSNNTSNSSVLKVGDIVNFAGGKHYTSVNATIGKDVAASKAKITSIYSKSCKHPYHVRAVNDSGANIKGVYGWVDKSAVSAINNSVSSNNKVITNGAKLILKSVPLYAASAIVKDAGKRSGTYYIWNDKVINNRIRITNSVANVGKAGKVTGWINHSDAKNSLV